MKPRDAIPPNEQSFICKVISPTDLDSLAQVVEFSGRVMNHQMTVDRLQDMATRGGKTFAIFGGNKIIGIGSVFTTPQEKSTYPLVNNLPPESIFGLAAAVDPMFRGRGLQKTLLEARKNLVREMGKETLLGSLRIENGASVKNVMSVGGRILYFLKFGPNASGDDPLRVIFEIDNTIENKEQEIIKTEDALSPQDALNALGRGEKRIVLMVKSNSNEEEGGDDKEADEIVEQILSADYVGTGVQILSTDNQGSTVSGVVFKHLSSFPPDIAKRLTERKDKIKSLL